MTARYLRGAAGLFLPAVLGSTLLPGGALRAQGFSRPFPAAPLLPAAPFLGQARHALGLDRGGWSPLGKAPRDPYLSPWVEGVLEKPFSLPGLASGWAARLAGGGLPEALDLSLEFRGLRVVPASRPELEGAHTVEELLHALFGDRVPAGQAGALPPALEDLLFPLLKAAAAARLWVDGAGRGMTPEKTRDALEGLAGRWTGRRGPDRAETGRLLGLAGGVDQKLCARAAWVLVRGLARLPAGAVRRRWTALPSKVSAPGYAGDLRLFLPTPWGDVVVGGPGVTVYRKRAFLALDLGGDDLYLDRAGGADPAMPVSVTVDLGGSDTYRCVNRGAQGAGLFGVGVLADLGGGDDLYRGGDLSQGAGLCGTGLLWDDGGRNLFQAGRASQGAGLLGAGILLAGRGPDTFEGESPCQGASGPGGAGILVDPGGDDAYGAPGGGTPSSPLPSQGGAAGWQEVWASGGTGLLLDLGGDDAYRAGRAAQGAGFFRGGGLLLDSGGKDTFQSGPWSQGMGSTRGVGLCMEGAGDGRYSASDSSQGAGHDMGLGMFLDLAGGDACRAGALSQGAGSWHGSGFFIDLAGDDERTAFPGPAGGVQGWGGEAEGWGSIGLFLDCGGKDRNSEGPPDGGWKIRGLGGLAIDSGGGQEKSSPAGTGPALLPGEKPRSPSLLSLEKDLHQALSSLPGSSSWKAAVKDLAGMGKAGLEWLAARAFASPTPAMGAFLEDAALAVGDGAREPVRKGLDKPFPQARALAARILGRLGDRSSRKSLEKLLAGDPSFMVRRAAAEALGRLGVDQVPAGLEVLLHSKSVPDRIAAAACLEGVRRPEGISRLLGLLLDDPAWPVRQRAERALAAWGSGGASRLREELKKRKKKGSGRIALVRILGKIRDSAARPLLLDLLEDPDPALRAEAVRALRAIGNKGDLEKLKALAPVEMSPLVRAALKGL